MIKRKYLVTGALCIVFALSTTGCKQQEEVVETTAEAQETENPNYIPYVQETVPDISDEALNSLDTSPHFDSYTKLQDMLEENAQAESRGASVIITDDNNSTENTVEETTAAYKYVEDDNMKSSLNGGSDIEIVEVQSFQYMSPTDGTISNGDILIFGNSDYIEIDPKIKNSGYTYTIEGKKLIITLDDGRHVEMINVGDGFVDSSAFTVRSMTKLVTDNCDFNTNGAVVQNTDYMNNAGSQDLIKIISSDQSDLATIFRSLNATYVMYYDGNMPYSYIELEQLIRPLKLN